MAKNNKNSGLSVEEQWRQAQQEVSKEYEAKAEKERQEKLEEEKKKIEQQEAGRIEFEQNDPDMARYRDIMQGSIDEFQKNADIQKQQQEQQELEGQDWYKVYREANKDFINEQEWRKENPDLAMFRDLQGEYLDEFVKENEKNKLNQQTAEHSESEIAEIEQPIRLEVEKKDEKYNLKGLFNKSFKDFLPYINGLSIVKFLKEHLSGIHKTNKALPTNAKPKGIITKANKSIAEQNKNFREKVGKMQADIAEKPIQSEIAKELKDYTLDNGVIPDMSFKNPKTGFGFAVYCTVPDSEKGDPNKTYPHIIRCEQRGEEGDIKSRYLKLDGNLVDLPQDKLKQFAAVLGDKNVMEAIKGNGSNIGKISFEDNKLKSDNLNISKVMQEAYTFNKTDKSKEESQHARGIYKDFNNMPGFGRE